MRYYILGLILAIIAVVIIAGPRGRRFQDPPIEIFPDMDRQLKVKFQKPSKFFSDGRAARPPVEGTVPMGYKIPEPTASGADRVEALLNSPFGEFTRGTDYFNTGVIDGNWGDGLPIEVTPAVLGRGGERYKINCAVCHGELGDGQGVVSKYNYIPPIANLHQETFRTMPDGQIYHTISHGKGVPGKWTMFPYGDKITVEDRWAIVAYVRALQRAAGGTLADVPEPDRTALSAQ